MFKGMLHLLGLIPPTLSIFGLIQGGPWVLAGAMWYWGIGLLIEMMPVYENTPGNKSNSPFYDVVLFGHMLLAIGNDRITLLI